MHIQPPLNCLRGTSIRRLLRIDRILYLPRDRRHEREVRERKRRAARVPRPTRGRRLSIRVRDAEGEGQPEGDEYLWQPAPEEGLEVARRHLVDGCSLRLERCQAAQEEVGVRGDGEGGG